MPQAELMEKFNTYESDEVLLNALRKGEAPAFEFLYRQYYRMMVRLTNEFSTVDATPEDLFQDVLIVLVRKVSEEEFRLSAKLSTFLYAIARNLLLKRSAQKTELPLDDGMLRIWIDRTPDADTLDLEERLNAVTECLHQMDKDCKRLLQLSFFEKRAQVEIAEMMGYSEAFVKVKKHRCLNYLRTELKKHRLFKDAFT